MICVTRGTLQAPNPIPRGWKGAVWHNLLYFAAKRRERELNASSVLTLMDARVHGSDKVIEALLDYQNVINYTKITPKILSMLRIRANRDRMERVYGRKLNDPTLQRDIAATIAALQDRRKQAREQK